MGRRGLWLHIAFILLLLCAVAVPLGAQPALAGSEIQLSPPGGDQPYDVALAAYPQGGFAAVWQIGGNVFARGYSADGRAVTKVIAAGQASEIGVAAVGSGFVVAGLLDRTVYPLRLARIYDGAGRPLGRPFVVETPASSPLAGAPRVVADARGRFVVAWVGTDSQTARAELFLRRFTATGKPLGSPQRVVRQSVAAVSYVHVAQAPDGRLLVTWLEQGSWQVFGQLLDPSGALAGSPPPATRWAIPSPSPSRAPFPHRSWHPTPTGASSSPGWEARRGSNCARSAPAVLRAPRWRTGPTR